MDGKTRELDGTYAVIFACHPTRAGLALAASRSAPAGALLVTTRGLLRSAAGMERRLSRLGFVETTSYWHWPSLDRCTHIIPLHDPAAVRFALTRLGGGRFERLRAAVVRILYRTGTLGWAPGSTTVVGRRGHGEASYLHAYLTQARWGQGAPAVTARPPSFVMLTPRFRSSRRVVFLLLSEDGSSPALVVKVPRRAGRCAATEREAERLAEIHALRPGGFDSIPRPLAADRFRGRSILVESAIPGRAMDRAMVRREPSRSCDSTLAWLIEVQRATRCVLGRHHVERLIESDLHEIRRSLPEEDDLVRATRDLVRPLYGMDPISVLEHGDLSHPNILVDPSGRVSVIDWESAEIRGLPAADLVFVLTYVARAVARARSSADVVRAVDRAFLREGAWARSYLRRYAEALDLPERSVTPLFVASWVRQVAGWSRRVRDVRTKEEPGTADALRYDWRVEVWRHTVHRAGSGSVRLLDSAWERGGRISA